jgi:hypothetical protein
VKPTSSGNALALVAAMLGIGPRANPFNELLHEKRKVGPLGRPHRTRGDQPVRDARREKRKSARAARKANRRSKGGAS